MSLFTAFTAGAILVALLFVSFASVVRLIRTNLYLKATLKEQGEAYRLLQRATQQRAQAPRAPAPVKKAPKKKRAPAKPRPKKVKLSVWDRLKKPEV